MEIAISIAMSRIFGMFGPRKPPLPQPTATDPLKWRRIFYLLNSLPRLRIPAYLW